jgi:hypothetical protein
MTEEWAGEGIEEHNRKCTVCGKRRTQYYVLHGKSHDKVLGYMEPHYWNWGIFCCMECKEMWMDWQRLFDRKIQFYGLWSPEDQRKFGFVLWESEAFSK